MSAFPSLPSSISEPAPRIGIASDHGGYDLKEYLMDRLCQSGYGLIDFGDFQKAPADDYPDYVAALARAVEAGGVDRGVAICGSGVGATIVANKVPGVRACLIADEFSARQGVEDDDLNIICLGGQTTTPARAWELVQIFLAARFNGAERHCRRLAKVTALEQNKLVGIP